MTPADVSQKMVSKGLWWLVEIAQKTESVVYIKEHPSHYESKIRELIFAAIRADPDQAIKIAQHVEHKPCPMCGNTRPKMNWHRSDASGRSIVCRGCNITTDVYNSDEQAWAAWDRRAEA